MKNRQMMLFGLCGISSPLFTDQEDVERVCSKWVDWALPGLLKYNQDNGCKTDQESLRQDLRSMYSKEIAFQEQMDNKLFSELKDLRWPRDRNQIRSTFKHYTYTIRGKYPRVMYFLQKESALVRLHCFINEGLSVLKKFKSYLQGFYANQSDYALDCASEKARITFAFFFMRLALCPNKEIKEFYKYLLTQMFNDSEFLHDVCYRVRREFSIRNFDFLIRDFQFLIMDFENCCRRFMPNVDLNNESYK